MSTEDNIEYGEIKNINTEFNGTNRIGDYGKNQDNVPFVFTDLGWRCINEDKLEAAYWKNMYVSLRKLINNN
jgi:hypothetical protein